MDILSSLTLLRPPKFVALYQRLWAEGDSSSGLWGANGNGMNAVDMSFPFNGLQMELLTGWPDDALLGISEVPVGSVSAGLDLREPDQQTLRYTANTHGQ